MRKVSVVGTGRIPIQKVNPKSLREMGVEVIRDAMIDADINHVDALFVGNMLASDLQNQKHLGALLVSHAGLEGAEALEVEAATATGAAALRMAYFAVASGEAEYAVAVGVEKMSDALPTETLAKLLDAERETPFGETLISVNARIMKQYLDHYKVPYEAFCNFALNAHSNAMSNPYALFQKKITREKIVDARMIHDPMRLFDCSPICDGAAAVVLAPGNSKKQNAVDILASSVATDKFCVEDREQPLRLQAAELSVQKAYKLAGLSHKNIDLFEAHDAFSIMACLCLEACQFAPAGQGWKLAVEKEIFREGKIPIATMGGLKARGHPIGATALYQTCEIVLQLTGRAGNNQVKNVQAAMLQSIGGAGTTVLTHIFGK